jgi:hypothetical protein
MRLAPPRLAAVRVGHSRTEESCNGRGLNVENPKMQIEWRHDVDRVLDEAKSRGRPVLIDFTAAPM